MDAQDVFRASHTVPRTGAATWDLPNGSSGPRLDAHLPVQVVRQHGDWSQVRCANGWTAWVDGRVLVGPQARRSAPATAPAAPSGHRFVTPTTATWPVSVGAALALVATVLPWIRSQDGTASVNAFDVPIAFLFDSSTISTGAGIGVLLVVAATVAFLLRHVSGLEKWSRLGGAAIIAITGLYVIQLSRLLGATSSDAAPRPSLTDVVGFGVLPSLAGAALISWGGGRR